MKFKSNFTTELKTAIEKDIAICEEKILIPAETYSVYNYLKAKYLPLYPHLCDGIHSIAKTPSSDWVEELRMFKGALEGILINNTEPQQINQQAVNIYIGKFKNSGIIGTDNQMTKSNELGLELSYMPKAKVLKRRN